MPLVPSRLALLGAAASILAVACDEPAPSPPTSHQPRPFAPKSRKPAPRPAPLPADGVMLTLPAPPSLGAETRALCARLDANLKPFGQVVQRLGRHLGYERRCQHAPARFAKLQRELIATLTKHRDARAELASRLATLPAAERPAFWRWLRKLRRWIEDELVSQVVATERAATRFAARCPRAARRIAKDAGPLDWLRVAALVALERLFTQGEAPKPKPRPKPKERTERPGWRAIGSLVDVASYRPPIRIPKQLSASTRRNCRRFALTVEAADALIRTYGGALRGKASCAEVARRVRDRDGMKAMWREVSRELGRSYAALRLVPRAEERRASRWAHGLLRRADKKIARHKRQIVSRLRRLLRRCRGQMRRLLSIDRRWQMAGLAGFLTRGLSRQRWLPRRERTLQRHWQRLMRRMRRR